MSTIDPRVAAALGFTLIIADERGPDPEQPILPPRRPTHPRSIRETLRGGRR